MRMKERHPLQGFFMHGVPRDGIVTDSEYITACVFCGRDDKFYINAEKLLFDCKVCGHQGNFMGFLEQVSTMNQENIKPEHLNALALDRELPVDAFEGYEIGWDDKKFTFPIRDYDGKFVGLRCYTPGEKMWNTANTKAGLFNAHRLKEKKDDVIWLCYADDTEILTKNGWKLFSTLKDNDFVAAYNKDTAAINFEKPTARQVFNYTGKVVHLKTNFCDLIVTPEHRVLSKYQKCLPKILPAFNIKKRHLLPTSGTYTSRKYFGFSENDVRLLACFQADGCWEQRGFKIHWNFKKERKKKRLEQLLIKAKISFEVRKRPKGYSVYVISKKSLTDKFDFNLKKFQWNFIDWPLELRAAFLDELRYWDGDTTGKKCWRYFTSDKENSELVSALASISGISVIQRVQHRLNRKNSGPEYVLNFKQTYWRSVGNTPLRKNYSGKVYCCTVSTGLLVVRRNGKVTIAGNCEGEWDAIAANWLIKKLNKPGVAVGVPGANTFLDTWIEWFFKRDVIVLYDNDAAGKKGEITVQKQLENHVHHINYLHWPPTKPDGYDLRDLIKTRAVKKKKPKGTLRFIEEYLENVPMNMLPAALTGEDGHPTLTENNKPLEPITFPEVVESFRSLLYMPDDTPIRVLLATVLANRLHTDMVWMFFVAPPASAKSELIQSLFQCKEVMIVDQLTQNTLLSGWMTSDKKDHSLLSKLDGCIMAMKDFTSVLTLPPFVQQTIFGQLRFAYDQESTARYGHGQDRKNKAHFGIVAGVTSAIEKFGITQSILGERFLRYHLPAIDDEKSMRKSSSYMGREQEIRNEIKRSVMRYLGTHSTDLPQIPEDIFEKIRNLSRLTARMRGVVDRDDDKNVISKPTGESPNRINKQLLAMINGLGSLEKKKVVGDFEFRIVRDIALGSCPERVEAVIAALHSSPHGIYGYRELEKITEFPYNTIKRISEDLQMLKLIKIEGAGFKQYCSLTTQTKEWIEKSEIYKTTSKSQETARFEARKGLDRDAHAVSRPRSVQIRLPKRP